MLTCSLLLVFVFVSFSYFLLCALVLYSSTMPRKTRANRIPSTPSVSPSRVQLFRNERAREADEKLNSKRKIWVEHSVILDEVDLAIRANLKSRGWLSLLEIDHPPPTALIREFFSNLSCHIYDSDITRSSIQWGSDPQITSFVLSKTTYLFLRVTCHSLWPISHLHTIPLERCVFLYAFMSGASISFPHLFLRSLNEIHRSSTIGLALIYSIFIHRIVLFLV